MDKRNDTDYPRNLELFGYISEAERLEERRSKMRQAEAIENAADNLGMFSGDLTVEIH